MGICALQNLKAAALPVALVAIAAFHAPPVAAADLPPSRGWPGAMMEPALGRADLRPVPGEWIAADAGMVVDASELVVLTPDAASADAVIAASAPLGYEVIRRDRLDALNQELIVLRIPLGRTGAAAIQEIEALDPRATAGVNHAYPAPDMSSRLNRFRYANALVGWPPSGCRSHARIGLVDTGIDPDVAGEMDAWITAEDFRRDPEGQTGTGHGTALALLLAGEGRLSDAEIFNAVVAGDGASLSAAAGVDDLLRALEWLANEGVRLVNISLAGPYNKILDLGIQSAVARGLVIVAAAGNDGPSSNPRYPAAFDDVIAVTAVDADGQIYPRAVHGPHIDFSAPGVDVLVPFDESPRFVTGTSVAAPFVTALLAADPRIIGPGDAHDVIGDYGRSARDIGAAGRDPTFGFGIPSAEGHCP